ncbi:MAG TPA: hypothetical protein VK474_00825 [Chthoniobacterales bacterium]|nr:hypothetical protein [Chthoniobacterales bacterium]
MAKISGWYELDVHAGAKKITITAEARPPGREPDDLRGEIAEVGMHGLSSDLLEGGAGRGEMRKLPGKPADCLTKPKRLSNGDVLVWKVVIT